jgi:hypothetical protein
MFAANTYRIRLATNDDTDTLRSLAERNGQQPLDGQVLIGEVSGGGLAALSLASGRVIADQSSGTDHVVANLRVRATSIWADRAVPSLFDRMLAGLPVWYRLSATPVQTPAEDEESAERTEPVLINA